MCQWRKVTASLHLPSTKFDFSSPVAIRDQSLAAHQIKVPILLIHGEADNNSGTFPIQSDRMYRAIKGNGGMVRYVTLPSEAHGYAARESIEHTLWEMLTWFDTYVKNPPDSQRAASSSDGESKH